MEVTEHFAGTAFGACLICDRDDLTFLFFFYQFQDTRYGQLQITSITSFDSSINSRIECLQLTSRRISKMVDLLAGARISGKAWIEKSNIATHAGLGVLLSTSSGRVRVKTMKPGYADVHKCR